MWQEHDSGLMAGGDVGGDLQVGESYSKRFVRDDLPVSMVTVTICVIEHSAGDGCLEGVCAPGELNLFAEMEYLICVDPTDPGGTEMWSDCAYKGPLADSDGSALEPASITEAEGHAKRLAGLYSASAITWDGVTQDTI